MTIRMDVRRDGATGAICTIYMIEGNFDARTPRQRLRQLDPSALRRGQTTSLAASETAKEEVREERGGISARI